MKEHRIDHTFEAEAFTIESWLDEEGVLHEIDDVSEIPLECEENEDVFVYFQDEDVDRRRYYEEEGNIVIRTPTKFSWKEMVIAGIFVINIIIGGAAVYFNQTKTNERILDKLSDLHQKQAALSNNIYTKQEQDLYFENMRLKIERNEKSIEDLEYGDRRSR